MNNSTVQMNPDIRVKVPSVYKGIYNGLKNHAVGDFHELFFLCVCLGYKHAKKPQIKKKEDCFWSKTITPDEWHVYYSLYVHSNNMNLGSLGNDEDIVLLMQDYATGGMEVLIDEFLRDYVKKDSSGYYIVDHTDQISKELLMTIIDWSKQLES